MNLAELAKRDPTINKILGMIYGQALGDAVGLITEFKFKCDKIPIIFPYTEQIRNFPVCDWTDDTDHLILVMQSITDGIEVENVADKNSGIICNKIDIAQRLHKWVRSGFPELGDTVGLGLGGTTNMVINHAKFLTDPHEAAMEIWHNSGKKLAANGCLMRTSIVGALPAGVIEKFTVDLCKITHADPRCIAACVIQSLCIHDLIYCPKKSPVEILQAAVGLAKPYVIAADDPIIFGELRHQPTPASYHDPTFKSREEELSHWIETAFTKNIDQLGLDEMVKIGFVLKCLGCSIYALQVINYAVNNKRRPDFKKFITLLASEGGDADTNCAVAGAMLGAYVGYLKLPQEWIRALPNREWLDKIIIEFLKKLPTIN